MNQINQIFFITSFLVLRTFDKLTSFLFSIIILIEVEHKTVFLFQYRLEGLFNRGRWGRVKKGPLATPLEDIFMRRPRGRVKEDTREEPC